MSTTRKFWYLFWIGECPVCGRDKSYKERVYGPKPKADDERYGFIPMTECYDWCLEWELYP